MVNVLAEQHYAPPTTRFFASARCVESNKSDGFVLAAKIELALYGIALEAHNSDI